MSELTGKFIRYLPTPIPCLDFPEIKVLNHVLMSSELRGIPTLPLSTSSCQVIKKLGTSVSFPVCLTDTTLFGHFFTGILELFFPLSLTRKCLCSIRNLLLGLSQMSFCSSFLQFFSPTKITLWQHLCIIGIKFIHIQSQVYKYVHL